MPGLQILQINLMGFNGRRVDKQGQQDHQIPVLILRRAVIKPQSDNELGPKRREKFVKNTGNVISFSSCNHIVPQKSINGTVPRATQWSKRFIVSNDPFAKNDLLKGFHSWKLKHLH